MDFIKEIEDLSPRHNKYLRWYTSICNRGRSRAKTKKEAKFLLGYVEGHHILPRCMCSNDDQIKDKRNIVYLTAREHFMAHWILTKIFRSYNLSYALAMFTWDSKGLRKLTPKQYQTARESCAEAAREHIKTRSDMRQGQPGLCTEERKKNIKESRMNTNKKECPHCGKSIDPGNYKKYHGDSCKKNPDIDDETLKLRSKLAKENIKQQKERGTFRCVTDNNKSHGIDPHSHNNASHTCPHCGLKGKGPTMKKHHFENCPHR